jgi:hypothetical protein
MLSKTRNPSMKRMNSATKTVGIISGSSIFQNSRQGLVPSTAAASRRSCGIDW